MDQASIAADIAQAIFYLIGSVAVIGGGMLAWRRFAREQPDAPRWELAVGEPRVRFNDGEFRFVTELIVSNKSRSPQTLSAVWLHCVHPDSALDEQPATIQEAVVFFRKEPERGRRMPPDSTLTFSSLDDVSSEPAIVRVEYALDVLEPVLLFGRAFKPAHHDDIALYRN